MSKRQNNSTVTDAVLTWVRGIGLFIDLCTSVFHRLPPNYVLYGMYITFLMFGITFAFLYSNIGQIFLYCYLSTDYTPSTPAKDKTSRK